MTKENNRHWGIKKRLQRLFEQGVHNYTTT